MSNSVTDRDLALRIVMFVLAEGGPTVLYLPSFVLVEGEH